MSKPTILTVDDDPAVSAAITRDLRNRYGAAYRIVRAASGAEALTVRSASPSGTNTSRRSAALAWANAASGNLCPVDDLVSGLPGSAGPCHPTLC